MQLIVKDDKLQRYRDHIQTGKELGETDKKYFDRYFYAFSLLLDGLSDRQAVKTLMFSPEPIGPLSQSQAYNVVNGCQQIFGTMDFGNAKKLAQRHIYATRLQEIAHKLESMGNELDEQSRVQYENDEGETLFKIDPDIKEKAGSMFDKAANVRMKAAKLLALLEKDKVENPNKYKVAPNLIFTDDIAALEMYRQIEDANYEDVTGNES